MKRIQKIALITAIIIIILIIIFFVYPDLIMAWVTMIAVWWIFGIIFLPFLLVVFLIVIPALRIAQRKGHTTNKPTNPEIKSPSAIPAPVRQIQGVYLIFSVLIAALSAIATLQIFRARPYHSPPTEDIIVFIMFFATAILGYLNYQRMTKPSKKNYIVLWSAFSILSASVLYLTSLDFVGGITYFSAGLIGGLIYLAYCQFRIQGFYLQNGKMVEKLFLDPLAVFFYLIVLNFVIGFFADPPHFSIT